MKEEGSKQLNPPSPCPPLWKTILASFSSVGRYSGNDFVMDVVNWNKTQGGKKERVKRKNANEKPT